VFRRRPFEVVSLEPWVFKVHEVTLVDKTYSSRGLYVRVRSQYMSHVQFVYWSSVPVQLLEGFAHLKFALSSGVYFSCVEEVLKVGVRCQYMSHTCRSCKDDAYDSMVPGFLHTVLDYATLLGPSVCQPSTKRQDRHLQSGGTEATEFCTQSQCMPHPQFIASTCPCPWDQTWSRRQAFCSEIDLLVR
jgi:hypothetical protein